MHEEPDLSVPLSKKARRYLINRGEDWRIAQIEASARDLERSRKAAEAEDRDDDDTDGVDDTFDEADDYNNWKVPELRAELNGRRTLAEDALPDDATEEQHTDVNVRYSSEGRKEDLVQRLQEDDRRAAMSSSN